MLCFISLSLHSLIHCFSFFFFNDTATTEIYTLSLHDALPISRPATCPPASTWIGDTYQARRSEEHTSELQSRVDLVCRLLLEKKKKKIGSYRFLKKKKKNKLKINIIIIIFRIVCHSFLFHLFYF